MPLFLNRPYRAWLLALCLFFSAMLPLQAAPLLDGTSRIAVMSAFEPELALLKERLQHPASFSVNGVEFSTGLLEGHSVVLLLSGISMVNAAMNTQLVLDRFNVSHIVFSGIAGGVNPGLNIGDVTVVERWGQYLEVLMAREITPGVFDTQLLDGEEPFPNFGMAFTRPVEVRSKSDSAPIRKFWFDVDPTMLKVSRQLDGQSLDACDDQRQCLDHTPRIVVGGNGVSGSAFVDNAALREHLYNSFSANVLDMESAACAIVAYANSVPFIAFRSLSDLAGGGDGANEMHTFLNLAARNSAHVLLSFLERWKPGHE